MNRGVIAIAVCTLVIFAGVAGVEAAKGDKTDGSKGFDKHCAACHANGGNMINPAKTLSKKQLNARGIKNANDIVAVMRKPGPGMTTFDKKTVPDTEAKAIADHILKSFK